MSDAVSVLGRWELSELDCGLNQPLREIGNFYADSSGNEAISMAYHGPMLEIYSNQRGAHIQELLLWLIFGD